MTSGLKSFQFPFDKKNLPTKFFINNEFVDSKAPSPKFFSVENPKDGALVSDKVPLGTAEDIDAAVAAAEAAFPAWRKVPSNTRRDMLLRLADLIEENASAISELTRITLGAPSSFGSLEIGLCAEAFRYFAGWIDKFGGETFPADDGFLKIVRNEPLGVTAGIAPWNAPMGIAGMKAAPALATGNCFILKPSEKTPFAALAFGALVKEAGFPPGVFQVVSGDGSTGAIVAAHMRIRKISFTGSTATGRKVQEMAAKSNLKRVTLELGGKSPAVVFDDANLDNAVNWCANAITTNTGQICFAASRVYVQEGIYDKFTAAYKKLMEDKAKVVGDPDVDGTVVGPLVDKLQHDRVCGFLERGKTQAENVLVGGTKAGDKGYFVTPTVFEGVKPGAEILNNEIFGPVAVLNKFKTEEEVLALANDTEYGLMAGVFTQDINKAMRISAEIDSGMVGINCVSMSFLTAPFGGSKQSGIGRENGINAMRMYTEPKLVFVNLTY